MAAEQAFPARQRGHRRIQLLVGSGDTIALFAAPFAAVGLAANILAPSIFAVGGPPSAVQVLAAIVLTAGVIVWGWSAVLILTRVPRGELITTGPYAIVKHPLYTAVALLVLPWVGVLCNTWLGAALGLVLYIASRLFAPREEGELAKAFGSRWDAYCRSVRLPWM